MNVPSLDAPNEIVIEYLKTLREGEKVIEHGKTCMEGCTGITYRSIEHNSICVMWNTETGNIGTSLTLGTRRIKDKPKKG